MFRYKKCPASTNSATTGSIRIASIAMLAVLAQLSARPQASDARESGPYVSVLMAVTPVTRTTHRVPRQLGCRPLALYTAAALGSARKSISAFAAIGCSDKYGAP